jgi:murein DD-endopeptidase MepM/ murein hydrolase activator NlpD
MKVAATADAPCPARDPEDGRCYPSADAADLAWIARGGPPAPITAEASGAEDDEDEGEEEGVGPEERRSFWTSVASTVKAAVVRKADSKPVSLPEAELDQLFATDFPVPLELFPKEKFRDSFNVRRGRYRRHHAIDLPAPRGTPVIAVAEGTIERLGRDRKGGKVVYLRDATGKFTFYYAHLRVHAKGLKAGDHVTRGQRLGEVGATGYIIGGPHLHFAIFRHDEASSTRAFVVNPYLVFGALIAR